MAELTLDGLTVRTVNDIKTEIETEEKSTISPAIDVSTTSPLGQVNAVVANQIASAEEGLAALYKAMDPSIATGDALDRLAAFNGVFRKAATRTSVTASLFFSNTGTYTSGALLANPVGSGDSLYSNVHNIIISSVPATASNVLMRAIDSGVSPMILGSSGSGTLTEQANSVAGWDGLFGSASLSLGDVVETDTDLRLRRLRELFKAGSTSVDGIVADISSLVSGVLQVHVFENTASFADADGIAPYAFEAVVYGPSATDANIAEVIFAAKAAGAPSYGTTSTEVADSNGTLHNINFTRPAIVPLVLTVQLTYQAGSAFGGGDLVKQAIITNASGSWQPGLDVATSQISAWVQALEGVLSVDAVTVFGAGARFTITNRQIAAITSSTDITVTSTAGTR